MNINYYLEEKGMTKYRLSKLSGVPHATLNDLCSGKTRIEKCSAETLYKIAKTLQVSMETLIEDEITCSIEKIEIQTIFMDNMKAIEKMFPEEMMEYYKLEVELYQAKEERYRLFIEEVNKQNKELKVLLNYFNSNNPSVKKYLENIHYKYMDKITVIPWKTSKHTQQDTCNDWLQNYGRETKWFICMDVDEFIHIKEQNKTLKEFLEENAAYSSVKCLWKHFTANGQEEKTPLPVRERFTVETDWGEEKHGGKFFAQSNRISHFVSYVPQVRLNSRNLEYDSEKVTGFYQLNHYITKSYEEWLEKIARGSVNPAYMRKYQEFFEINPDMQYLNTGENTMQKYGE